MRAHGCWLWQGAVFLDGYGVFSAAGRLVRAHRMSWLLTNGVIPEGQHVLHYCDTPLCVRPDHLFLGTPRDNIDDMLAKERSLRGVRNPKARLSEDDVREIRRRRSSGETLVSIALDFGITHAMVSQIARRVAWGHL